MTAHTASSKERLYAAIDLKSFYASVECMDRGLDPLTPIWWWRIRAVQKKPSVWQCLLL